MNSDARVFMGGNPDETHAFNLARGDVNRDSREADCFLKNGFEYTYF